MSNPDTLINEILTRSIDKIVDQENILKRLKSGKQLVIKLGIDPTSPNIHLGRTIPLLKLKRFQELGHKVVLIIGDFTAVIGDTSDKNAERPMLAQEMVANNLVTYIEQVKKIIDIDKTEVHHNTEWLGKLTYAQICEQANVFSVNEFIDRSNIKTRLDKNGHVSLREVLYPMMQGYDSVAIKADIELGGSDQWFNLLAGRKLQKHFGQEPQDVITNVLIEGLDGRKMSSSWGNTINLNDNPQTMFGKIMSMRDELIGTYFEHLTLVEIETVNKYKEEAKTNPMETKLKLATEITTMYWGVDAATEARENFDKTVRNKEIPTELTQVTVPESTNIIDALKISGLATSNSEARRLIDQKGISINQVKVTSYDEKVNDGDILQKGSLGFVKIKIS